jgi:hypothetical protein
VTRTTFGAKAQVSGRPDCEQFPAGRDGRLPISEAAIQAKRFLADIDARAAEKV